MSNFCRNPGEIGSSIGYVTHKRLVESPERLLDFRHVANDANHSAARAFSRLYPQTWLLDGSGNLTYAPIARGIVYDSDDQPSQVLTPTSPPSVLVRAAHVLDGSDSFYLSAGGNGLGSVTNDCATMWKFNSSGVEQWYAHYAQATATTNATDSVTIGELAIDANGDLIATHHGSAVSSNAAYFSSRNVSTGARNWTAGTHVGGIQQTAAICVRIDSAGDYLLVVREGNGLGTSRLENWSDNSGSAPVTRNWTRLPGSEIRALDIDGSDNAYIAAGNTVEKVDTSGSVSWTYNHGAAVHDVTWDASASELVLAGDEDSNGDSLVRLNSSGVKQSSFNPSQNASDNVRSVLPQSSGDDWVGVQTEQHTF